MAVLVMGRRARGTPKPTAVDLFEQAWRLLEGPALITEHKFHPRRKWAFDYAHLGSRCAIETEGGTFHGGRHTQGRGYSADCAKYNQAILLGWSVFRLTVDMLEDEPAEHVGGIIRFIRARENQATKDGEST